MIAIDSLRRTTLALAAAAGLTAAPAVAQQPPAALNPDAQRQVVDSVAAVLRARYVDEDAAARVGARLRERLAAGAYAADTLPAAFAGALTRDMYAASQDLHMRLSYEPSREFTLTPGGQQDPAPAAGVVRTPRIDPRDSATIARNNFGYERVERLAGNIGYLKLNEFQPLDYARQTAGAAMAFLAGSDAVIIDLRDNYGGSPDHVRLLMSYFFADSVHLWTTGNRRLGIANEYWSLARIPGRRMAGADLYVLTSGRTASAADWNVAVTESACSRRACPTESAFWRTRVLTDSTCSRTFSPAEMLAPTSCLATVRCASRDCSQKSKNWSIVLLGSTWLNRGERGPKVHGVSVVKDFTTSAQVSWVWRKVSMY